MGEIQSWVARLPWDEFSSVGDTLGHTLTTVAAVGTRGKPSCGSSVENLLQACLALCWEGLQVCDTTVRDTNSALAFHALTPCTTNVSKSCFPQKVAGHLWCDHKGYEHHQAGSLIVAESADMWVQDLLIWGSSCSASEGFHHPSTHSLHTAVSV